MEEFWNFVGSIWFIVTLVALLVILIGVFIFLRMRKRDDE
jgi:hypothetical protein